MSTWRSAVRRCSTPTVVTSTMVAAVLAVGAVGIRAQSARQGMLSLDDARLFYEVVGAGEPLVVVHGGPGLDHAYLRPGLDVLSARHAVVYYDQRGTGRSSVELTPEAVNFDAFVDDIEALREALGYDRISVLGHSFGSRIALEYAARYPDRLRALVLLNPVEPGTRYQEETAERQRARRSAEDAEELERLRATEGFAARDAATLSEFYRVVFRAVMRDPERIDEVDLDLATPTAKNGQDVAALLGRSMPDLVGWEDLGTIDAPVLVVQGRFDATPVEMARDLAEAFPRGTLAVLETGHFPFVEDRDGLLSAVSAFFAGLR